MKTVEVTVSVLVDEAVSTESVRQAINGHLPDYIQTVHVQRQDRTGSRLGSIYWKTLRVSQRSR